MRLLVSMEPWAARLFAVLAITPVVACGGAGGGGQGGQGGAGGTHNSGSTRPIADCQGATPVVIDGKDTGFVDCVGGWTHRPTITACPNKTPTAGQCGTGAGGSCGSDADCTAKPYGHCEYDYTLGGGAVCACSYGCTTDAECPEGNVCVCGDAVGRCMPAGCKSDADCGAGRCATYSASPFCGPYAYAFACQTDEDECTGDSDCTSGTACIWTGTHRVCSSGTCSLGRPFLVRGEARLAKPSARGDWRGDIAAPSMGDLDGHERTQIAARWTKVALMEHASVAAFARFVLQLLSLGAPPDLVKDAQAAMADETRHAEMGFALASAYAGESVGPGRLSIDRAMESCDLHDALVTAIHEGCVGETVAAIEAAETAARVADPAVRAALSAIAEDEARHAELAWRFVRWVLQREPALVRAAEGAFAEAQARAPGGAFDEGSPRLLAHGVPGEGLRAEIWRRAVEGVVMPCAESLLAAMRPDRDEPPPTRRVTRVRWEGSRS